MSEQQQLAILALEDGSIFTGTAIGAIDEIPFSCGELVFNTSMTGYQEIISDPSYCEQVILFTSVHIGNVGTNIKDQETNNKNKIWSKGIVIKSNSHIDSSWRSDSSLNAYLSKNKLIGICNLDTREITNILRSKGAQKCCIYVIPPSTYVPRRASCIQNNLDITGSRSQAGGRMGFTETEQDTHTLEECREKALKLARDSRSLVNLDLAKEVTTEHKYIWTEESYHFNTLRINNTGKAAANNNSSSEQKDRKYHIVVYDFGVKQQILKLLVDRKCIVTVVPANTTLSDLLELKPDGVLLSNGPGDPAACKYAIANTLAIINQGIPVFGICLGFQILALALGASTQKMKFGHHGGNHPVKDLTNNKVFITSQNHGFMVSEESITDELVVTHKSLFDQTVQGLMHQSKPVFGFQGHPEASPGPNDIEYLFDKFIENINLYKLTSGENHSKVNNANTQDRKEVSNI